MPIHTEIKDSKELDKILQENKGLVVIKLGAIWCSPCQRISPVVEEWTQSLPSFVNYYNLDIDENFDIYGFFKVKKRVGGIPAILVWKAGNISHIPDLDIQGGNVANITTFFNQVCALYPQYSS
jgi:thiol-disulfide isomerase/thioredoxin